MEDSENLYPACFENGTPLARGGGNDTLSLIEFKKDKLYYMVGNYESCLNWGVFYKVHKVKARVIQNTDVLLSFSEYNGRCIYSIF